jgi:glycosyltransferase involved in cell wall biosynthesis
VGTARPPRSGPLRILYHGTLVPERLPRLLIDALATIGDDWQLVLVGYGTVVHPDHAGRLRARAARLGVLDRLDLVGPVPRAKLFDIAKTCHVGLSLVPVEGAGINLMTMTGPSNKPFDYLASGLALLVSDLPAWRRMFVDPGYGVACDPRSLDSVAAAVRRCLEDPEEVAAMGARGLDRIRREWNYEHQFAPVAHFLGSRMGQSA